MQSPLKLGLLLLLLAFIQALQFEKFTRSSLLQGSVIKVNRTVIDVSTNRNSINLSWDNDRKKCEIPLDSSSNSTNSAAKAVVLGNGKIILWTHERQPDGKIRRPRFVAVDHQKCEHSEISKEWKIQGEVRTVVAYNDSFDVFSVVPEVCTPCRYTDKGQTIKVTRSIVNPVSETKSKSATAGATRGEDFRISAITENDPSDGYFYAYEYNNCSTLLRRLNSRFEVVTERFVNYTVDAFSTAYGKIRVCSSPLCKISGTSKESDQEPLICQLLDANLKPIVSSRLDQVSKGRYLKSPIIQNLPNGGAQVSYVYDKQCYQGEGEGAFGMIYDQLIDADGKVQRARKFDEDVLCWDYRLESLVLDLGEYCTVAYDGVATSEYPQSVYTRCTLPSAK